MNTAISSANKLTLTLMFAVSVLLMEMLIEYFNVEVKINIVCTSDIDISF